MMEEQVEGAVQAGPEPKIGPGRDLREAREARNLTLEAVAKQLHLDIAQVRALEEDDYDKFAAPIFVTGHLRTYARLLGVAPEPLIKAYQNLGAPPPPLERVARLKDQPESMAPKARVPRWAVYVLAAAVVVVVILVWRTEVTKLLTPVMETSPPELSLQPLPAGEGMAPAAGDGAAPSPAPPAAGKLNQAVSTPPPDPPQAILGLNAEKPSWVEVRDGTGKRLFYDLMVPGDSKRIEGVPPFDILLGYAPGVSVEYNGKQVDHAAFTRQDMARFRVGDKGASKR